MITLEQMQAANWIAAGEAHFARLCARSTPAPEADVVEVATAALCRFLIQGHPCLPLAALAEHPVADEDGNVLGALPTLEEIRAALAASPSVVRWGSEQEPERPSDARSFSPLTHPLVLDEEERLYVARFFDHERRLARGLARLFHSRVRSELAEEWFERRLDHYFPPVRGEIDLQREAAERALRSPLSVISGGPGTGKTSTVVKILGLFFDEAEARGAPPPAIKLLAPTGKAAARMMEAISSALERMERGEVLAAHVQEASTIHRALGVIAHNKNRFRRGVDHPLRADVVIVDEASMVDLSLMRHLVEALSPDARLILLGDRHQLASVEAGSVLSELCAADLEGADRNFTIELQKSYRFAEDSGIAALSRAIRGGDGDESLAVLQSGRSDAFYYPDATEPADGAELRKLVVERYGAALRQSDVRKALSEMSRFRVLCAHRKGKYGVETLNELIRNWLVLSGGVPVSSGMPVSSGAPVETAGSEFYRGRLVLITENDYEMSLYNGDTGIIWPGEDGRPLAFFPGEAEDLRALSPAQLPAHETAFALSIHKSQGSEHDSVALVLPSENSPLLTRELVYTAVTRARKEVHVFGEEGSVRTAAARSVTRHSGLSSALIREVRSRAR